MKIVKHADVPAVYQDLVRLFPHAVIVEDDTGVLRFQEDQLTRWLVDSGQVDLNRLAIAFEEDKFSAENYMTFYRGLGYSLNGFCEFFESACSEKRSQVIANALRNLTAH